MNLSRSYRKTRQNGFTLIELLLVITILATIGLLAAPVSSTAITRNNRHTTAQVLTATLRQAYINSRSMNNDSAWGVRIEANNIVLFSGDSYAARDINFDEETSYSGSISVTNSNEVVFTKFTGLPDNTDSFIITDAESTQTTIEINTNGNINYQ